MKQLAQNLSTGEAVVVDVPAPCAGRGQILVRVKASLISSGTERSVVEFAGKNLVQKAISRPDLVKQLVEKAKREGWLTAIESARRKLDSEMTLGYSNAGVVIEVGEGVTGFSVGDCVACAGGGYATHSEIVRIPQNLAAKLPEGRGMHDVPFEEMAFGAVAAVALQGIRLAEPQLCEVVAVIGLGLIGQIAVQLLRANGCVVVGMDLSPDRCRLAEKLGASATAASDEEMQFLTAKVSSGRGADSVLITAATESDGPVSLAAEIARDRARVIAVGAVGLSLPRKPYYMKELDFRVSRSYGPGRYDSEYEEKGKDYPLGYVRWTEGRNVASILQLLATRQIDVASLISHRIPIGEGERGYELIANHAGTPPLGVVLVYPAEPSLNRRVALLTEVELNRAAESSVRLGLLGAGNFVVASLLPAIKAAGSIELAGICAAGGSSARTAGTRYGFRFCCSDVDEILHDDSINTVAICTRHATHASQVVAALNAGKHVFCEKPLAMNREELAQIAEQYKFRPGRLLLMVGHNRRFAPLAVQLKAFFQNHSEPLAMHYRVNAGFIPPDHWVQDREQGGGRIIGEVSHFVDFLSYICGQPVISVCALLMPNVGRYCDDNLAATLRFADGSIGTIAYVANGDKSFSKERVEVFGQGRVAVLDDYRSLHRQHDGKSTLVKNRLRVDKGHRGEWVAFRDAIRDGKPSPIPFAELMNATLATISLVDSAAAGQWIDVDTNAILKTADNSTPAIMESL